MKLEVYNEHILNSQTISRFRTPHIYVRRLIQYSANNIV